MCAYADRYGLQGILSEDVSDGQLIGTVRIRNPFKTLLISGNDVTRGGSKR